MHKDFEELLLLSDEDPKYLVPVVERYTTLVASTNLKSIKPYSQDIVDKLKKWEGRYKHVPSLRLIIDGTNAFFSGRLPEAQDIWKEAVLKVRPDEFSNSRALCCLFLGVTSRSLGALDAAVKYLTEGCKFMDENGRFIIFLGLGYYQLGEIYMSISDLKEAKFYYYKAVDLSDKFDSKTLNFRTLIGLSNFHLASKEYKEAERCLNEAFLITDLSNAEKSLYYHTLGVNQYHSGQLELAEISLTTSHNIRVKYGFEDASSTSLIELGRLYLKMNLIDKAEESLETSLQICLQSKAKSKLTDCYGLLAEIYSLKNKWEQSVNAYKLYSNLSAELNTIHIQNIYTLKNEAINQQKVLVEKAHREITSSINYAKRIQRAVLPTEEQIKALLPNSFILYIPRDIVAGDFYWVEEHNGCVMFACADCTGHGVPGAMLSLLCNNALKRSVREFNLTDPGKILDKTREIIIDEFDESDDDVKDGMDISLCVVEGKKLSFAGAYNPLWIFRNDELIVIKGDRQPIGKFIKMKPFSTHQVELQSNDVAYLFSDGFADQFGGPESKKFTSGQLKRLLNDIKNEGFDQQKQRLLEAFKNWKGNTKQLDDVCVFGVKY